MKKYAIIIMSLLLISSISILLCGCSENSAEEPEETTAEEVNEDSEEPETTEEPMTVIYSTNTVDTVNDGNKGVYAYRDKGGSYYKYYIIDFDEGYVYSFNDESDDCDRLKIDSGDLNDVLMITYHDGGDSWSYGLHFKYKDNPDHLIMQDNDGYEYDYYTTNLKDALAVREGKTIQDY